MKSTTAHRAIIRAAVACLFSVGPWHSASWLGQVPVSQAVEVRVKDVVTVEGDRSNSLTGVGLVVGLNNTGGKSTATREFAVNVLQRFGNRLDPRFAQLVRTDTQLKTNSLSAVVVTADLPVFKRPGQKIAANVAAFDDAKSLLGGILVFCPLLAVDGEVYATAQGPVKVGGFTASGAAASVQKNHPTTGTVEAVVERQEEFGFGLCRRVRLLLDDADFLTALRLSDVINETFPGVAHPYDEGSVMLTIPDIYRGRVSEFIAVVQMLQIVPDSVARVVINERTGTVVVGEHVKLSAAAITHANLNIVTSETPQVSQPAPLSGGETVVVPRTEINVQEETAPLRVVGDTATVGELVSALNALGASPRDLATIFEMLKAAGALHAELELR